MLDDPSITEAEKPLAGIRGTSTLKPADIKLLGMALREHWPMSEAARATAIKRLEAIVLDPGSRPRPFHNDLKAFTALSRVNLTMVELALKAQGQEDIDVRLREIESSLPRAISSAP